MCEQAVKLGKTTWKERLIEERAVLESRIRDLIAFLEQGEDVGQVQESLLRVQLKHMKHYASCLNLRIEDLKSL